jgi:hypothetical protein
MLKRPALVGGAQGSRLTAGQSLSSAFDVRLRVLKTQVDALVADAGAGSGGSRLGLFLDGPPYGASNFRMADVAVGSRDAR